VHVHRRRRAQPHRVGSVSELGTRQSSPEVPLPPRARQCSTWNMTAARKSVVDHADEGSRACGRPRRVGRAANLHQPARDPHQGPARTTRTKDPHQRPAPTTHTKTYTNDPHQRLLHPVFHVEHASRPAGAAAELGPLSTAEIDGTDASTRVRRHSAYEEHSNRQPGAGRHPPDPQSPLARNIRAPRSSRRTDLRELPCRRQSTPSNESYKPTRACRTHTDRRAQLATRKPLAVSWG
jgi:hypothetical protein